MNRILYENRCRCNEIKKRNLTSKSEGKRLRNLRYPDFKLDFQKIKSKTFQIKYQRNLSLTAKFLLNNFQNKYVYYAIADISDNVKLTKTEKDNLLAILCSSLISLQNNFSVNFLDIWISEIYINEIAKTNKFFHNDLQSSTKFNLITVKLFYKTKSPVKQKKSLW